MKFLNMVQDAVRWSGARVEPPDTLEGADGVVRLIADFIAQAWEEVQIERIDWLWRTKQHVTGVLKEGSERFFIRGSSSLDNTFEGYIDYTRDPAIVIPACVSHEFSRWTVQISEADSMRPESSLEFVPYHNWRINTDTTDSPGQPLAFTISPEGVLLLFPIPDKDYRLYMSAPLQIQLLEKDNDEPKGIPEQFQKGLIWRGVLYYGMYHSDASLIEIGRSRYKPYKKWLERSEVPPISVRTDACYRGGYRGG